MFGVAKRGQNSIGKYLCKKHKISILHRVNSPIHSHPPSLRTAVYEGGRGETAATFERMYGYRDFFERKMYGNKGDNAGK
jgi:hypothetical protein